MKKRSILLLLILLLSLLLLPGCYGLEELFVSSTRTTKIKTTTNKDATKQVTTQVVTTDYSVTTVLVTTTIDGITTKTTQVETTTSSELNNAYKIENVDYTYYNLGIDNEFYTWRYINSIGNQKVLVIPIKIQEYADVATEETREMINEVMFGNPDDNKLYWESLSSYYYKSSYGKLSISGEVTNYMYDNYNLSTFASNSFDEDDEPLQDLFDDFDSFLASEGINPKDYDSDNDGYVDMVFFIYCCEHSKKGNDVNDNYWAYCTSADKDANLNTPTLNNFIWASYDFMFEAPNYKWNKKLDAHTYIHEFGHAMGLDDYYNSFDDNADDNDAAGSNIMMSANICDHDAYSKFSLGWINPYVVTGNTSITISPTTTSGDAIILPIGDFEDNAFAQYLIFEYYKPNGLNEKDVLTEYNGYRGNSGSGIRAFYIDSRVFYCDNDENTTIIDVVSRFDSSKYSGLSVAFSNNYEYSLLNEFKGTGIKPTEQDALFLIQLIDASTNSLYYSDIEATSSQLFSTLDTLDTSKLDLHLAATLNYNVSFKLNLDGAYTLTFTKK